MAQLWSPILVPRVVDFHLLPMSAYGPAATSGMRQAVASVFGAEDTRAGVRSFMEAEIVRKESML